MILETERLILRPWDKTRRMRRETDEMIQKALTGQVKCLFTLA